MRMPVLTLFAVLSCAAAAPLSAQTAPAKAAPASKSSSAPKASAAPAKSTAPAAAASPEVKQAASKAVQFLDEQLNLTDAQIEKLERAMSRAAEELNEMRKKMLEVDARLQSEMDAILDEGQKEKFKTLKAQMGAKMAGGAAPGRPSAPPPAAQDHPSDH